MRHIAPDFHNGFTLIETLTSIFVLAIAIMGSAGLVLNGLREHQRGAYQSAALQLAVELADLMRSNDAQMRLADGNNRFLALDYTAHQAPTAPAQLCYASACSADQMAGFSIYEWQQRIFSALPNARVRVCRDGAPWNGGNARWDCDGIATAPVVIKIGWRDKGRNPDGSATGVNPVEFPPTLVFTARPYTP